VLQPPDSARRGHRPGGERKARCEQCRPQEYRGDEAPPTCPCPTRFAVGGGAEQITSVDPIRSESVGESPCLSVDSLPTRS
jgi:hypothetical protein